jgi:hypothetical protein
MMWQRRWENPLPAFMLENSHLLIFLLFFYKTK